MTLAASLNLDAFTLEAGWEHGREVDEITLHTSVDRLLHALPMTFFSALHSTPKLWHRSFSFDTSPCHSRVFEQLLLLAGGRQLAELLFGGLGLTSIQRFSIGDRSGLLPGHVPFSQKPSVMSQKLFLLENVSGHVWQKFGFGLLTICFSLCIV